MRISVCYINTFMSNTVSDSYSRKAHINQQTDMAMSYSVDSYLFYTTYFAATAHFVVHIRFRKRKYAVIFVNL